MQRILLCLLVTAMLIGTAGCSPRQSTGESASSGSVPEASGSPSSSSSSASKSEVEAEDPGEDGPFSKYYSAAQKLSNGMTLEEKAGQVLLGRCPTVDGAVAVAQYHLGGFVLFGRDFSGKTRVQVAGDVAAYQAAADIPLLLAVDEEGGDIVRISSNPNLSERRFLSPQEVYATGGLDGVYTDAAEKAALLTGLGLNLNLGPVCDVSADPTDYIFPRTFGLDAAGTADCVKQVVLGMQSGGVISALKHFPGYGNNKNTHTGIAVDSRPFEQFEAADLLPFKAGIAEGAECVLVSHVIVECLDMEFPASLSPAGHKLLREELGFGGVIITDDLAMDAIADYTGGKNPAVQALLAGNDLLIVTDYAASHAAIVDAVSSEALDEAVLNAAVTRVLAMKFACGVLQTAG